MMLSSRRVWCGLFVCLLAVISVFIRPVRDQAAQLALRYSTGADVGFAEFKLHPRAQLVELRKFRTYARNDSHDLRMTAEQAILLVDFPKVLDKQLLASKVKLKNVEISVEDVLPSPPLSAALQPTSNWKSCMDTLAASMQWEKMRQECDSLLAADDILKELESKMQRWLLRSQQILLHASQLTQSIQAFTNPLRHTVEIRRQMQLLIDLAREQTVLEEQLSGVNASLTHQLEALQAAYGKDVVRLRSTSEEQLSALKIAAAEQVIHALASELWSDQAALGQAIQMLLQPHLKTCPFNLDVRKLSRDATLVSLSGIDVDGKLTSHSREINFQAKGILSVGQSANYRTTRDSAWKIEFQKPQRLTSMDLRLNSQQANWNLKSSCESITDVPSPLISPKRVEMSQRSSHGAVHATSANSDALGADAAEEDAERTLGEANLFPSKAPMQIFTIDAIMSESRLSGSARLNLAAMAILASIPCHAIAELQLDSYSFSGLTVDSEEWIAFELRGDWDNSQLALASPLPHAFVERLTRTAIEPFESARANNEQQLKKEFALRSIEIQQQIEGKVSLAKQTLAKHRESLSEMRNELENALQYREGYEYARLPMQVPTTNR